MTTLSRKLTCHNNAHAYKEMRERGKHMDETQTSKFSLQNNLSLAICNMQHLNIRGGIDILLVQMEGLRGLGGTHLDLHKTHTTTALTCISP